MQVLPIRDGIRRLCRTCGRFQNWIQQFLPLTSAVAVINVLISVVMLTFAHQQLQLAQTQRSQAEAALASADSAKRTNEDVALALSEVLLATLVVNKGRYGDSAALKLTAPYVEERVQTIFEILGLPQSEREARLEIVRVYGRWMTAPEGSPEKAAAWEEFERLTAPGAPPRQPPPRGR